MAKNTTAKKTATEQTIAINLKVTLSDYAKQTSFVDGKPSVSGLVSLIADTDAYSDSDLDLSVVTVKMKDGTEHTMLKDGDTYHEIGDPSDVEGLVSALTEIDLPLVLRLVAEGMDADADESDKVLVLA